MARAIPHEKWPLMCALRPCRTTPANSGVAVLSDALHVHNHDAQGSQYPHDNEARLHLIRAQGDGEPVICPEGDGIEADDEENHRQQELPTRW